MDENFLKSKPNWNTEGKLQQIIFGEMAAEIMQLDCQDLGMGGTGNGDIIANMASPHISKELEFLGGQKFFDSKQRLRSNL